MKLLGMTSVGFSVTDQPTISTVSHLYREINFPGARPPPLLRRSSFPVHIGAATSIAHQSFTPKERISTPNGAATPTKSTSRKASIDGSEGDSSPDMGKRRVRFLRRY